MPLQKSLRAVACAGVGTTSYAQSTAEYPPSTPSSTPCLAGLRRGRSGLPVRRAAAVPHHPQPDEPRVFRVISPEFARPAWRTAAALARWRSRAEPDCNPKPQDPPVAIVRAALGSRGVEPAGPGAWAPKTHTLGPHTLWTLAAFRSAARSGEPSAAASRTRIPPRPGPLPERARGRSSQEKPLRVPQFALSGESVGRRAFVPGPRHSPGRSGKPTPSSARLALAAPQSAADSRGPRSLGRAAPREGPGGNEGGTGRGSRD